MKNIVIISESATFPWGMASTSRVKLIAKGLIHKGHNVRYIGLRGADADDPGDKPANGRIEEVEYNYPGIFTFRPDNWILKRIDDILGFWCAFFYVIKLNVRNKIDLIILYTRKYIVVKYWSLIAKALNIKVLLEICEWPESKEKSLNAALYCQKAPLLVDGVMPISEYIDQQIRNVAETNNTQIPSFKIPILIDPDKFSRIHGMKRSSKLPYLLYSGSINYRVITSLILHTVCLLQHDGYRNKLVFTGGGNKARYRELFAQAREKKIDDLIEFTGYLEEDIFIEKVINAGVLLAPIPDDLQTKSRFPTKLGFYLMSGNPVITCPFGEVKKYLTDNENVIYIEKFNAQQFKSKIIYVLNNDKISYKIGQKGRNIALMEFDYKNAFHNFDLFINKM